MKNNSMAPSVVPASGSTSGEHKNHDSDEFNANNTESSEWPDVSIDLSGGVPTLQRDGQPWFGWGANRPIFGDHYEIFERLAAQGLRHFHFDATCSEDIYSPQMRFWHGPGLYNSSFQQHHFSRLADICDEALWHLRIYAGAPDWWLDAHPDHCQVYSDGSASRAIQRGGVRRLPSLASPLWREEACGAMYRYVRWLVDEGWSRRVFALLISNGITWEWGLLGSDGFLDYSEHGQKYFRDYTRQKYGTNEMLSIAWGRETNFADVAIPTAERRGLAGGISGLRPIPAFQDVIDHQQSLSEMNVDLLLALAAAAKDAAKRKVLVGAFYGYTLTAREHSKFTGLYGAGGFQGGHHSFRRALRSTDLDYFASPFSYANRDLGTGLLCEHLALGSVLAHGKAFFDENDIYPHTNQPENDDRAASISIGVAKNLAETVAYQRLAFGQAIVRGKHQWLTELTDWVGAFQENFNDPDHLAEIRLLNGKSDQLLKRNRAPVAEVAFVLDEKSVAHLSLDHKDFSDYLYRGSVLWGHTGAPFDLVLLDDLLENRCPPYRLIVPACVKAQDSMERLRLWLGESRVRSWWDEQQEWYPPLDTDALVDQMIKAGVHRYTCDGSTVWANASMLLVHVDKAGERMIQFLEACRGREFFSGKEFTAEAAICEWKFGEKETALFLFK